MATFTVNAEADAKFTPSTEKVTLVAVLLLADSESNTMCCGTGLVMTRSFAGAAPLFVIVLFSNTLAPGGTEVAASSCLPDRLATRAVLTTLMGDCALVEAAGIEIVLVTLRNQAMGSDLFTQLGCDLAAKQLIVVKSSQHFYASFSRVGKHVIYVAAPGSVTLDLRTLPYQKIQRPKWPLDALSA